ncbi:MAG: transposase [Planctomycetes bacterium]|nr:transposase [Planctomycetota bacterium]
MSHPPVVLTGIQQRFVQQVVGQLCHRGGWTYRACSAGADHVHVLLDIDPAVDGERVRRILKRWLTQALDAQWGKPPSERWWAKQGSNRPVANSQYLRNVCQYIERQRA